MLKIMVMKMVSNRSPPSNVTDESTNKAGGDASIKVSSGWKYFLEEIIFSKLLLCENYSRTHQAKKPQQNLLQCHILQPGKGLVIENSNMFQFLWLFEEKNTCGYINKKYLWLYQMKKLPLVILSKKYLWYKAGRQRYTASDRHRY